MTISTSLVLPVYGYMENKEINEWNVIYEQLFELFRTIYKWQFCVEMLHVPSPNPGTTQTMLA